MIGHGSILVIPFCLPYYIQLHWRIEKSFFFLPNLCHILIPLSYPASLKTISAVELSAVFGAPSFSQLGRCVYITG